MIESFSSWLKKNTTPVIPDPAEYPGASFYGFTKKVGRKKVPKYDPTASSDKMPDPLINATGEIKRNPTIS
jgi:hypothetical protein